MAISLGVAALVGIAGALFLAGPALFADGPADERMTVVAVLAIVLGLCGVGLGFFATNAKTLLPWFLAAPTIIIAIAFAAMERSILVVALLLIAGAIGFSLGGVLLGARLRRRRTSSEGPG